MILKKIYVIFNKPTKSVEIKKYSARKQPKFSEYSKRPE